MVFWGKNRCEKGPDSLYRAGGWVEIHFFIYRYGPSVGTGLVQRNGADGALSPQCHTFFVLGNDFDLTQKTHT